MKFQFNTDPQSNTEALNARLMKCPSCGWVLTHFVSATSYTTDDDRPAVALLFSCEEGCEFAIDFWNHKGWTLVGATAKESAR